MNTFLIIIVFVLSAVGLFNLLADRFEVPRKQTIKSMLKTVKLGSPKNEKFEIIKSNLARFLAKFIRINPYKREEMLEKLATGQIAMPPEEFLAAAMVKPILLGLGAVGIMLLAQVVGIFIPIFKLILSFAGFAFLIIAVLMYFKESQSLDENIKQKREEIEAELPRFASVLSKSVMRDKNVLAILTRYKRSAGKALAHELDITTADMTSGNEETALMRMESRVNSSMLSDVVRGLIAILQGNDTRGYWENLELRLSEIARQNLEKQALKIPDKMKKLTLALMACFMGTYFVVLGVYIYQNITSFS